MPFVQTPANAGERNVHTQSFLEGGSTVNNQIVSIGGSADAEVVPIPNSSPGASDYRVVVGSPVHHTINETFKESAAIGGMLDDVAPTAATEGNIAPVRVTAQRGIHANLRDNAGTEVGTASDPVRTDPTGTTTQPVSGTITIGTFPDNEPFNMAQVSGTAVSVNAGNVDAGTQRVVVASDQGAIPVSATNLDIRDLVPAQDEVNARIRAQRDDTAPATITEGNYGDLRLTEFRALHANIRAIDGTELATATDPLRVDPTGTTTQPVSGTVAISSFPDNEPFNLAQVSGTAVSVNAGNVDAGTQRVVIASDQARLTTEIETPLGDSAMDDVNDAVRVNIVAGAAAGGTSMTDDAAFTPGSTAITPVGGTYRTVRDSLDDNDAGALALTATRALYTSIETPAGDSAMDDANDAVRVNIVAGGGSGGTAMADDGAFTVGSTNFTPIGGTYRSVRDSVDDNDAGAIAMTQTRALYAAIETPLGDSAMDDVNDALRVNIVAGGGSGGTAQVDDAAFTVAVDNVTPMGALADETTPDSVDEGDIGAPRMSLNRVLYGIIRDAAGNERGANVTAANNLTVAVNAALPAGGNTIGGVTAIFQQVDDAAFTPGTTRVANMGAMFDDVAPDSVDEGDAGIVRMSANRNLYSTIRDAAGNERGVNVNASNQLSVSVDAFPDNEPFNVAQINGVAPTMNAGNAAAGTLRVVVATDQAVIPVSDNGGNLSIDLNGTNPSLNTGVRDAGTQRVTIATDDLVPIQGEQAHSAVEATNPILLGAHAVNHGSNPSEVAAADLSRLYSNRAGIPFVIGGHPNILTREYRATGAQTDDAIIDAVGANTRVVVTKCVATVSGATTPNVGVRIGFGTATVPAEPANGASVLGVVLSHDGIPPGSGDSEGDGSGIIGVGAVDEELRITNDAPTDGDLKVIVTYYTIDEA